VQDAALGHASVQAQALRDAASARADQVVAAAGEEAAELLAARRARAERLADLEEHERLAEARAQAGATVLSAQRMVLSEATAAVRAAARRLTVDRRYARLLERLEADARRRLEDGEPVQIVPVAEGGFVARAGSRELDYSLDALLERCLEAMTGELERLWG